MPLTRKALALSLGISSILSAATIAQNPRAASPADDQLVVEDATVEWFQKSDVSALREGVIKKMELRIGMEVSKEGAVIGYLHKEVADLAVEEAKIQAEGQGAIMKAEAQRNLALKVVARNESLAKRGPNFISREEVQKGEAEFLVADAGRFEAQDTQKLAVAKLNSAKQAAEEHIIRAPFAGQILEEFKHKGESVGAREPVVRIGNLDIVRVWAYIPVEYALRVAPGTKIIIEPRFGNVRVNRKFKGVISAVDQTIQPVAETAVRIHADLDNPDHFLKPGLKATMTITLEPEAVAAGQARNAPANVGTRTAELPPLPR